MLALRQKVNEDDLRPLACQQEPSITTLLNMERVTGIGGIFFKARDRERLSAWYREHLGIPTEDGHADFAWREHEHPGQVGRTVWSVFPAESDYFGRSSSQFMVNYRVANLDRMLEQLRRSRDRRREGGGLRLRSLRLDYGPRGQPS